MKISPINRFFTKASNFGPIAIMWGVTSVAGTTFCDATQYLYNIEDSAKKEIFMKDPARYERLTTKTVSGDLNWSKEAIQMNDSLKMDSIIQKAYFEGAQMVRDSIAGANKNELK